MPHLGQHGGRRTDVIVHHGHRQPCTGHHVTGEDVLVHAQLLMSGGDSDAFSGGNLARLETETCPMHCEGGLPLKIFAATFSSFYVYI